MFLVQSKRSNNTLPSWRSCFVRQFASQIFPPGSGFGTCYLLHPANLQALCVFKLSQWRSQSKILGVPNFLILGEQQYS